MDLENLSFTVLRSSKLDRDKTEIENRFLGIQQSSFNLNSKNALLDSTNFPRTKLDLDCGLLQSAINISPKFPSLSSAESSDKANQLSSFLSSSLINTQLCNYEATPANLGLDTPKNLLIDNVKVAGLKTSSLTCENTLLKTSSGVIIPQDGNLLDATKVRIDHGSINEQMDEEGPVGDSDLEPEIIFSDDFEKIGATFESSDFELHDSSLSENKALLYGRVLKLDFINALSGALIASPKFNNASDPTRQIILEKALTVASMEPDFLLKVAVYSRRELNLRTPTNFLLAVAASIPECRPFMRQYFGAAIILPTDWIEVAELYRSLMVTDSDKSKGIRLPAALRRVMTDKFMDFDTYQLAKHNKGKKTNKKTGKEKVKIDKSRKGRWRPKQKENESDELDEDKGKPKGKLNLKQLIRALHIQKPALNVMAIVGKRYPSDPVKFQRSGLLGVFDESKVGKRLKLPMPETWETRIAREGNKPEVWQQLLDRRKLPFMAMLRNLKNMIKVGIAPEYHTMVLKRLQDENSVTQSKQFPFRFFSAYQALDDLEADYEKKISQISTAREIGFKFPPRGKRRDPSWWVKKRQARKMREDVHYDLSLLNRYRKALDISVKIATTHNVSPIRGRTIVFCKADSTMDSPCTGTKGLGKPKTTMEIGALLALLCKCVCEDCVFLIVSDHGIREIDLTKGTILKNVEVVLNQAATLRAETDANESKENILGDTLRQFTLDRTKINNLLLVTNLPRGSPDDSTFVQELKRYRDLVFPDLLYVNINLSPAQAERTTTLPDHPKNVYLRGYSDQILRYITVRGSDAQLIRIDHVDVTYKLKKAPRETGKRNPIRISDFSFLDKKESEKTNVIKVFVSSTFRDMHGERTVLLRYVFPELQRRASQFGLTVLPIDLRWGVSEADVHSMRSLGLCLREVSKCQLFVGFLGERHGWRPSSYDIGDSADEFSWLSRYPLGASVTELEIEQFALQDPHRARGKCFFYFRGALSGVPESYCKDIYAESEDARKRIMDLKQRIKNAGHSLYESYPCRWSGVHEGLPSVSGLEILAQEVVDDLWQAICNLHRKEEATPIESAPSVHISKQWQFIEDLSKNFVERHDVMESIGSALQKSQGHLVALEGPSSCGLTSLMAHMAVISRSNQDKFGTPIVWFEDVVGAQMDSSNAIGCLYDSLAILRDGQPRRSSGTTSLTAEMWTEYLTKVVEDGYQPLFILDGLPDHLIEWLIEVCGKKVNFLINGRNSSIMLSSLEKSSMKVTRIPVRGLNRSESASLVRKVLAGSGKRFEESAFDNQMRVLLSKRDADKPSYLLSACEYLKLYAVSEKIGPLLLRLPSNMESLAKMVITQAEKEHWPILVTALLAFIAHNEGELTTSDLYQLCALATEPKNSSNETTNRHLPYSKFLFGLNALRIILREESIGGRAAWAFTDSKVAATTRIRCGKSGFDQKKCMKFLAAYFLQACDPSGDRQFLGVNPFVFTGLFKALVSLGEWEQAHQLLSSLDLIKKGFELGFASSLMAFRSFVAKNTMNSKALTAWDREVFDDLSKFSSRNSDFLLKYPSLFDQQVLNEPMASCVTFLIPSLLDDDGDRNYPLLRWDNKPEKYSLCDRSITFDRDTAVRAVAISPNCRLLAVAVECVAKVFNYDSGEELHSFSGHQDVINHLCFVNDTVFCSCGDDGLVIVWDTSAKVKLSTMVGHDGHVSMCIPYTKSRSFNLITAGWDSSIRLWNQPSPKAYEVISVKPPSPVNCLDCYEEDGVLVTGHWNGAIMIHCLDPVSRKAILRGHRSAVRSVAYNNNGMFIASASFDGEVRLWSAEYGTTVGSFVGHLAPVNRIMLTKDYLVSASDDCAVKLWSPMLGRVEGVVSTATLQNSGSASTCALSPDGRFVAIGYSSNTIVLYDLKNKNSVVWTNTMDSSVVQIRFVPIVRLFSTSKALLVACRSSVKMLDFDNGEVLHTLDGGEGDVTCAGCSATVVVVGHTNGALCCYSLFSGQQQKKLEPSVTVVAVEGSVSDCAVSPDGRRVATVSTDKSLSIWRISDILARKTKQPEKLLRGCHGEWITSCAWSNTKNIIATASSDCTTKLWDADGDETPLVVLKGHSGPIIGVRMQRGCIVTASLDGTVAVWSHKGILVTQLKPNTEHRETPTSLDFLLDLSEFQSYDENRPWAEIMEEEEPDEGKAESNPVGTEGSFSVAMMKDSVIAVCYSSGSCRIWNPFLGDQRVSLISHTDSVIGLDAMANGSDLRFVTGGADGCCNVWSVSASENLENHETTPVHRGMVTCICVRPAGDLVCSGGLDGYCALLNLEDSSISSPFIWKAHEKSISCALWTDEYIMTGSEDGLLKLWAFQENAEELIRLISELSLGQPIISITHYDLSHDVFIAALWSGEIVQIRWNSREGVFAIDSFAESHGTIRCVRSLGSTIFVALANEPSEVRIRENLYTTMGFPRTTSLGKFESALLRGTDEGELIALTSTDGKEGFRIKAHTGAVTGIATFPRDQTGLLFATISKDCFVRLWKKTETVKLVGLWLAPAPLTCLALSEGGKGKIWCGDALGRVHQLSLE